MLIVLWTGVQPERIYSFSPSTSCVSLLYFLCQSVVLPLSVFSGLLSLSLLPPQLGLSVQLALWQGGRSLLVLYFLALSLSIYLSLSLYISLYLFVSLSLSLSLSNLSPFDHLSACWLPEIVSFIYVTPLLPAVSGRNQKFYQ